MNLLYERLQIEAKKIQEFKVQAMAKLKQKVSRLPVNLSDPEIERILVFQAVKSYIPTYLSCKP